MTWLLMFNKSFPLFYMNEETEASILSTVVGGGCQRMPKIKWTRNQKSFHLLHHAMFSPRWLLGKKPLYQEPATVTINVFEKNTGKRLDALGLESNHQSRFLLPMFLSMDKRFLFLVDKDRCVHKWDVVQQMCVHIYKFSRLYINACQILASTFDNRFLCYIDQLRQVVAVNLVTSETVICGAWDCVQYSLQEQGWECDFMDLCMFGQ
jgi:hypothetical protein